MQKPKRSPNQVYTQNLAVVSAQLELGAAAIHKVMGGEALSNQVLGKTQSIRDIQEMIGSRLLKAYGA